MKKLIPNYTFTPSTNTVVVEGIYRLERFLIITNVTANETLFLFNNGTKGVSSYSIDTTNENTTLVLDFDCSAMGSTDKLQIFVELDSGYYEPSDTYVDPVSKLRVSQPENLIDTDFEYGLQSTKWETLELVKNIPTFFSRNGDESLTVTDITTVSGSDVVTVTVTETHNFLNGTPLIVSGSKNITCDGGFVVTTVIDANTFQYKSKAIQNFTGSILGDFTQVFAGSVYQGTEFDISGIDAITTDGLANSKLTVSTTYPTKFELGTSFYLSNSVGQVNLLADSTLIETENYLTSVNSTTNNTATGETGFSLGGVQPYDYTGTEAIYFINGVDITVNITAGIETITFNTPHGMIDNETYLYVAGEGNTAIGGLTTYTGYYVRVVDSTTIYLTTTSGGTTRVNLTSGGASGGVMRSAFIRGYRATSASTSSALESITFNRAHGLISNSDQALLFFNGTSSSLVTSSNLLSTYTVYYPKTVRNTTSLSFTTSPGGAQLNLSSGIANSVMIKASLLEDRDSIYFSNHGLSNNDFVTFNAVGAAPGGLANGTNYKAEVVGTDRIRFKNFTTDVLINLTSIGQTTGQYSITSKTAILQNDSISIPNHNLTSNTEIVYNNNGNANIGGLINGTSYYVFEPTVNTFKLSSTPGGWSTNLISFSQTTVTVNITSNVITTGTHGFTTGQAVQYLSNTPIGGLISGAFYWVRAVSATTLSLHWTKAGASANTDIVILGNPRTGTGSFRQSTMVDLTSTSSGTHIFSSTSNQATDGVYSLITQVNDNTFELQANNQIPERAVIFQSTTSLNLNDSAIYKENHSFVTGQPVVYSTSLVPIGGLVNSTTYYVIRVNNKWFKLASSASNAEDGINITFTSPGSGDHTLTTASISGEITGPGTLTITEGITRVSGTGTNFPAVFSPGDILRVFVSETTAAKAVSAINTTSDVLTTSVAHGLTTGNLVRVTAAVMPAGLVSGGLYYVRVLTTTTVTLHPSPTDATNNTSIINMTTAGTTVVLNHITALGSTVEKTISYVNSFFELTLLDAADQTYTDQQYSLSTALLLRADGFALHRPYDGGVELIPSKNPDSTMIRQTRRYFRYQSGKGIQVSFAVNFSPTTTIDTMSRSGTVATITTRYPHRLDPGLEITISGATVSSGTNYWNGVFEVATVVNDYTFTVNLSGTPIDPIARGLVEYYVNGWSNSKLKCGLFDDQNGLYFEYDGQKLHCVRRSSTLQVSGFASVQFKSGAVFGTNTKFTSQLSEGDSIVIKGQTYRISKIENDTLLYILPSYRGIDATNVIITKTVDTAIPQDEWNIDKCDGTGPTGFYLDIHKIQMAYMDYSWYGAGKVRFGFKDQRGTVRYVHEFIHNNKFTEAYMRSGNIPARYEIENVGTPSYVPALAHWGTSVIMDGRFDDDRAYVFTASSNTLSVTGSASLTVSARVETLGGYQVFVNGNWRNAGTALRIATPSSTFNSIPAGVGVSGAGISAGTLTRNPLDTVIIPRQPYLASVDSRYGGNNGTRATRNLLIIDRPPTVIAATDSNYTVTLSSTGTPVVYEQPLISIRLAPSVDNGIPGALGQREIINRMQLILDTVGVLTTHSCEVLLKLNGSLNNFNWRRVTNPSLSQLLYHDTTDTITGGTVVYTFRAQGGTGTTGRSPVSTSFTLDEIATLGNSILGGNGIYPDGPDVLTVVVRLLEDPSTVTSSNPFTVSSRISWSESQA